MSDTIERSNPNPFLILLVLAIVSGFFFPMIAIIYPPYTYSGLAFISFGIIMDSWSTLLFLRSKTTTSPLGAPTALMAAGPFRISRNPMYLGMAAVLAGVAILSGALVTFIFPAIFIVIIETRFIPREEKSLEKTFGQEYEDYKSKVRRWI